MRADPGLARSLSGGAARSRTRPTSVADQGDREVHVRTRSLSGGAARSRTGSLARRRICNPPRYRPVPAPCCPQLDGGARGRSAGFRAGPRPYPYSPRPVRSGGRQLPRPDPSSPAYRHLRSSAPLWLSYPEPHDGGSARHPMFCLSFCGGYGRIRTCETLYRACRISSAVISATHPRIRKPA